MLVLVCPHTLQFHILTVNISQPLERSIRLERRHIVGKSPKKSHFTTWRAKHGGNAKIEKSNETFWLISNHVGRLSSSVKNFVGSPKYLKWKVNANKSPQNLVQDLLEQ